MVKGVSILFLLLVYKQAFCCSTVRLDLDPNVLGKVPPHHQGNTLGCYAFAATQLIDAQRISSNPSKIDFLTSPLALAIETGDLVGGSGGEVANSIKFARMPPKDVLFISHSQESYRLQLKPFCKVCQNQKQNLSAI